MNTKMLDLKEKYIVIKKEYNNILVAYNNLIKIDKIVELSDTEVLFDLGNILITLRNEITEIEETTITVLSFSSDYWNALKIVNHEDTDDLGGLLENELYNNFENIESFLYSFDDVLKHHDNIDDYISIDRGYYTSSILSCESIPFGDFFEKLNLRKFQK